MKATTIFFAAFAAIAAATPCVVTLEEADGHTYKYDLRALHHEQGEPDIFSYHDTDGNYYYINFCGPTSQQCASGTSVCMRSALFEYTSLGRVETEAWNSTRDLAPGRGLKVTYRHGDACKEQPSQRYQTTVVLKCNPFIGEGYIQSIKQSDCAYDALFITRHACGVKVK